MKIFHAAETIKGGVATVMRQLAIAQSKNNNVTSVKCLVPDNQVDELSPLEKNCILGFSRSGRNIKSFLSFSKRFFSHVYSEKPDIVHLHSTFAGFLGRGILFILWPLRRPKVVYCPHAFSFIMTGSNSKSKIYAYIEKVLSPITDKIVCVSDFEKQQGIENGLSDSKLIVIHNGVPVIEHESSNIVSPYKSDVVNLLFVGRFDYQKGFDILEFAMEKLKGKPFHLTAVGGSVHGSFNENKDLPQTSYTGWLSSDQIVPYFKHADVLIIPSRWEGFAMVPLEAMSYGVPILSSNSTSLPEVVIDGYTGKLFSIEKPEALVSIIENTTSSEWENMGINAKEYFLNNFTADKMISKTDSLYNEILKRH